jgi:hypothetical protein
MAEKQPVVEEAEDDIPVPDDGNFRRSNASVPSSPAKPQPAAAEARRVRKPRQSRPSIALPKPVEKTLEELKDEFAVIEPTLPKPDPDAPPLARGRPRHIPAEPAEDSDSKERLRRMKQEVYSPASIDPEPEGYTPKDEGMSLLTKMLIGGAVLASAFLLYKQRQQEEKQRVTGASARVHESATGRPIRLGAPAASAQAAVPKASAPKIEPISKPSLRVADSGSDEQ